ncbi:MAG: flagellar hook-length control protein FliK [Proteobacteria bacterium]|nr:flagellar hook-length control protein FliK [Pseudomonadota bacterium]
MPAPVSPSTTTIALARTLFASAAQSGARDLPTGSTGDSFSSTLQNRLDSASPARDAEHTSAPERGNAGANTAYNAESASGDKADGAPAAKNGERPAAGNGQKDGSSANAPDKAAQSAGKAGADAAEHTDAEAQTAGAATAASSDPGAPAELARRIKAAADDADQSADAGANAALNAGLPADLAALLPQLAATRAADGAPKPDPATDDSLGKSLQNSGLLPRMEAGTQGADRGVASALMLLQAREGAASASAGKIASGPQGVEATASTAGAGAAASAPGSALPHQLSEFAAIRGQAVAARPLAPQLPVHTPVGQDGWAEEIGNRVTWMLGRAESKAELVLTPPNLGKLEVSINLNGDQTTAQFIAANQAARDALEQAMPRLREMLAGAGISLGETSVSTSGEQQAGREGGGGGHPRGQGEGTVGGSSAATWLRQHDGMVDTFV